MGNKNHSGSLIAIFFLVGSILVLLIGAVMDTSVPEKKNPYGPDSKMMNPVQYSEQGPVRNSEGNIREMESPFKKK